MYFPSQLLQLSPDRFPQPLNDEVVVRDPVGVPVMVDQLIRLVLVAQALQLLQLLLVQRLRRLRQHLLHRARLLVLVVVAHRCHSSTARLQRLYSR